MSRKKKNIRIRGWRKQLKFIFEKLTEGLRPADYREEKGEDEVIPHGTLNNMLKFLKDSGIAFEDENDGKWYYTWKKEKEELIGEYERYKNWDEYRAKLEHSKILLGSAVDKARVNQKLAVASIICGEYLEYFLQHLEEGYPDVFELFNQWKRDEAGKKRVKDDFEREVKRIASEKGIEIMESSGELIIGKKQAPSAIFNSIKRYWKLAVEEKLEEKVKLELREGDVFDPLTNECIAVNKDIKEDLEGLIKDCIHAKNMESLYKTLKSIEDKENEDYSRLSGKIIKIIGEVKLGNPLKGSCGACKFLIG